MGVALGAFSLVVLLLAFQRSWNLAFYPAVFTYGEGVMTWMTWKFGKFESPYGDILGMPSIYSCYGPLPALFAAGGGWIAGSLGIESPNLGLLAVGRAITFFSWISIVIFLALVWQRTLWQRALCAMIPVGVFAGAVFMYAWRIDPFLCALLAGTMLFYSRSPNEPNIIIGIVLALLVAMTKPTALFDFAGFACMGVLLGGGRIAGAIKHIALCILAGLGGLVIINFLTEGWFFNNIFYLQLFSGWKDFEGVTFGLRMLGRGPLFPLVVFLLIFSLLRGEWRMALLVWFGLAFTLATHTKEGGAENYYLPLSILCAPFIARTLGNFTGAKFAAVAWAGIFIAGGGLSAEGLTLSGRSSALGEGKLQSTAQIFRETPTLAEDSIFPVLADTEPLVSDIFQLIAVKSKTGGNISPWLEAAGGRVLGGGRLLHVCGDQDSEINLRLGGGEHYIYYPSFHCAWRASFSHNSPWRAWRYTFAIVGGGLVFCLGFRRWIA